MSQVADRLSAVKPSASMAVSQAAKDLRATGVEVIDLGLGEPDFSAPAHVTEAAFEAARGGRMLYTASLGTPDCRKAVASKFKRENGLDYEIDEIAVANGAKQIIRGSGKGADGKDPLAVPQHAGQPFRCGLHRRSAQGARRGSGEIP